jgi:hypothetical protein
MVLTPWTVLAAASSCILDSAPITTRMSGSSSFQIKLGIS